MTLDRLISSLKIANGTINLFQKLLWCFYLLLVAWETSVLMPRTSYPSTAEELRVTTVHLITFKIFTISKQDYRTKSSCNLRTESYEQTLRSHFIMYISISTSISLWQINEYSTELYRIFSRYRIIFFPMIPIEFNKLGFSIVKILNLQKMNSFLCLSLIH